MDRVLILDTEATGVFATDRVVEIGVILWSIRHATRLAAYSTLIDGTVNPAQHINHIPPGALVEDGADEGSVWERLAGWVDRADAVIAHSFEFDRKFAPAGWDGGKPWICSMNDIEWPESRSKKLVDIVLDHNLGIAGTAHRALDDCMFIERLLAQTHKMGHDVEDMLRQAARPKAMFQALVSYDEREKAKLCGFQWDKDLKEWRRRMVPEDTNALPFPVREVAA